MVIHDSNLDTDILVVLECRVCVDLGEAGKPGYPEKSPEAQERSTTGPVPPPPPWLILIKTSDMGVICARDSNSITGKIIFFLISIVCDIFQLL